MNIFSIVCFLGLIYSSSGRLSQLAARLKIPGNEAPPGTPWPQVKLRNTSTSTLTFDSSVKFEYHVSGIAGRCDIIQKALDRYSWEFIFHQNSIEAGIDLPRKIIQKVELKVDDEACPGYPQLSDDPDNEGYTINVRIVDDEGLVTLSSKNVWGALRALETWSQLIWHSHNTTWLVNETFIEDSPRYPHRGLMIDSARHYLDMPVILTIMDGMTYNKLNVLHWHIVDDQSFPFVSRRFPTLSEKGAYFPELVYTPEDVDLVMNYGRERGIRIVLEFDTPGHTWGFRPAFPQLITPCYGIPGQPGTPNWGLTGHADYEILDPTKNFTYEFIEELFEEIVHNVTKDEYLHLGMDEVYYACWNSSPEIKAFMNEHGYVNLSQVQGHYTKWHIDMVQRLGSKVIIWNDPIDYGVEPNRSVLLEVWKGGVWENNIWPTYLKKALNLNYSVILSSPWYLNYIDYGETWKNYFQADPVLSLANPHYNLTLEPHEESLIKGGEACVWAEYIDSTNIVQRLFPFVGAVAERLWSPQPPNGTYLNTTMTDDAKWRLDQFRCLLLWRGLPAQPIFNGVCSPLERSRSPDPPPSAANVIHPQIISVITLVQVVALWMLM